MTVKHHLKGKRHDRRLGLYHYRGRLKRCPNQKCGARNSPNAEICWRCGQPMN